MSSDDDEELEEESLLETPLDRVEPYGLFKNALMSKLKAFWFMSAHLTLLPIGLQQDQPQLYHSLVKVLNPEEEQIVQSVIVQADAVAMAVQAEMNGATMNGTTH